jgi:hypothetical protein
MRIQLRFEAFFCLLVLVTQLSCLLIGQAPSVGAPLEASSPVERRSPAQVLDATMAPFLEVRSDLENWSPFEKLAYENMVSTAHRECEQLKRYPYQGEELFALARICSVGKDWDNAYSASSSYSRGNGPNLRAAFEILFQSELGLRNLTTIVFDASDFVQRVPYGLESDSILSSVIDALEFAQSSEGVSIALLRQQKLLPVIKGNDSTIPYLIAARESWQTIVILRYSRMSEQAEQQRNIIEQAISQCNTDYCKANVSEDSKFRRQYELLGTTLTSSTSTQPSQSSHPASLYVYFDGVGVGRLQTERAILQYRNSAKQQARIAITPVPLHVPLTSSIRKESVSDRLIPLIDAFPFFVLTDARQKVLFVGKGSLGWFEHGAQLDQLLAGTALR